MTGADARRFVADLAAAEGLDVIGVTSAALPTDSAANFRAFIAQGHHGTMQWLADSQERRADPHVLWPQARSIIMLAMSYAPAGDPLPELAAHGSGYISVYARNRDYHDIIKGRLKQIAGRLVARLGGDVKVFVDTAPVMEKPLAARAGLGWQGKHTNLVSRRHGSWLFLGAIFTNIDIAPDAPESDHCGTCKACLDICPTSAFPGPYQLDARRCISYLTIEHKGHIDATLRPAMGNRIYGCDDCLAVCPWNKFARHAREAKLMARDDLRKPALEELLKLDDAAFRKRFSGSPIKRIGRDRFVRNVLIAAGNSGAPELASRTASLLADASPLVRAMAVWALARLTDASTIAGLDRAHTENEHDCAVQMEWKAARAGEQERT